MRFGYENYDSTSYQIGALVCFAEMVHAGVKRIALSGALTEERLSTTEALLREIAKEYPIKYHAEYNLVKNLIVADEYIQDKYVFMLYRDDSAMDEYRALKDRESRLIAEKSYNEAARHEINAELCRLLSYPEDYIRDKFGEK